MCIVISQSNHRLGHDTDAYPSTFVDNSHPTSASEECTDFDVSTLELQFVPSPPVQESNITLFGRARFGSQPIDIMKEELCHHYIVAEETGLYAQEDLQIGRASCRERV